MKIVYELCFEETLSVDHLQSIGERIAEVVRGQGPVVYHRMLVELQPTYLEIPITHSSKPKSRGMASPSEPVR